MKVVALLLALVNRLWAAPQQVVVAPLGAVAVAEIETVRSGGLLEIVSGTWRNGVGALTSADVWVAALALVMFIWMMGVAGVLTAVVGLIAITMLYVRLFK